MLDPRKGNLAKGLGAEAGGRISESHEPGPFLRGRRRLDPVAEKLKEGFAGILAGPLANFATAPLAQAYVGVVGVEVVAAGEVNGGYVAGVDQATNG